MQCRRTTRKRLVRAVIGSAALYGARRYYRNWGTTKQECQQNLPGDEHDSQPAASERRPGWLAYRPEVIIRPRRAGLYVLLRHMTTPSVPSSPIPPLLRHRRPREIAADILRKRARSAVTISATTIHSVRVTTVAWR